MIIAYHDPGFAAPIGNHIMPIAKFQLVADTVRRRPEVRIRAPEPIAMEDLLRVHTPHYVEAIRTGIPRDLAESQKFPWSPGLWPSVCLTNGGCLAAARSAMESGIACAIASGFHHAHADHGEGFCTFNGLVVALDRLHHEGKIRRGAVFDLDLHYGNGTASLAAHRPHLTAVSIYGNDFAGNVPYRDVSVRRHGDGPNHLSFALPRKCDGATLQSVLQPALERLLESGKPDLLFYQAGADPYYEDPYSPLLLNQDDLRERDRSVFAFTQKHGIPIAWVLAGGYTRDINKVVQVHVNTFEAARDIYES